MDHTTHYGRGAMFLLSFVITLLVMGFMVVFLLFRLVDPTPQAEAPLPVQPGGVYLPSAEDRLTLFAVVEGESPNFDTFVLAGFYPDTGSIPLMVLPRQLEVNGVTLQQIYRQEGLESTTQRLEALFNITIHRVASAPGSSAAGLLDRMGSVDFQLPMALADPSTGLNLSAGLHQIDGQKALALANCPSWPGGEPQRCVVVCSLLAEIANTHLPLVMGDRAESLFKTAVNACHSTNLTSLDFEEYLPAARFMAKLAVSPAQALELTGSFDQNGVFVPDADGQSLLQSTFD